MGEIENRKVVDDATAAFPSEKGNPVFSIVFLPIVGRVVWNIVSPFIGTKMVRGFVEAILSLREIIWMRNRCIDALRRTFRSADIDKGRIVEIPPKIRGNIMVINGTNDAGVTPESSKKLSGALSNVPE